MAHSASKAVEIAVIADPVKRLKTATAFLANGRQTITEVKVVRDDAIRELSAGGWKRSHIALKCNVSLTVVINALRRPRDSSITEQETGGGVA